MLFMLSSFLRSLKELHSEFLKYFDEFSETLWCTFIKIIDLEHCLTLIKEVLFALIEYRGGPRSV